MLNRRLFAAHLSAVLSALSFVLALPLSLSAAVPKSPVPPSPVHIDFSYAGYEGGGHPLPAVKAVLFVRPTGGDDTALLQSALDRVAARPIGADGFRGALLLSAGRFHVAGQLHLNATGVVLRGAGAGANGTTIIAEGIDRRTLIEIGAASDPQLAQPIAVAADAPAGTLTLALASVAGLHSGDRVLVRRPSTSEWISAVSMSGLPGTFANQRLDWRAGVRTPPQRTPASKRLWSTGGWRHQPRVRHSARCGRSAPSVVSLPWPG